MGLKTFFLQPSRPSKARHRHDLGVGTVPSLEYSASMVSKFKAIAVAITVVTVLLAVVVPNVLRGKIPTTQKLIDCTNNFLTFQMACPNLPPYQFLLGVLHRETNGFSFQGDLSIRQGNTLVARIPIGSSDLTPCNWLHQASLDGYILTWSRTNETERLSELLQAEQVYNVQSTMCRSHLQSRHPSTVHYGFPRWEKLIGDLAYLVH
jgi:hypothetical protein